MHRCSDCPRRWRGNRGPLPRLPDGEVRRPCFLLRSLHSTTASIQLWSVVMMEWSIQPTESDGWPVGPHFVDVFMLIGCWAVFFVVFSCGEKATSWCTFCTSATMLPATTLSPSDNQGSWSLCCLPGLRLLLSFGLLCTCIPLSWKRAIRWRKGWIYLCAYRMWFEHPTWSGDGTHSTCHFGNAMILHIIVTYARILFSFLSL